MKTYPLKDDNGFQFGFEIDNVYIGISKIAKLLSAVNNVSSIMQRRLFDFRNVNHIEFDYWGNPFIVMEPFGDNSRYWICPRNKPDYTIDISNIEVIFKQYKPPFFIKLLGDIISLNFIDFKKK
jgi:hypothetical protein